METITKFALKIDDKWYTGQWPQYGKMLYRTKPEFSEAKLFTQCSIRQVYNRFVEECSVKVYSVQVTLGEEVTGYTTKSFAKKLAKKEEERVMKRSW